MEPTGIYLLLYAPENFRRIFGSDFASSLVEISGGCIPQTSAGLTGGGPWCNDSCGCGDGQLSSMSGLSGFWGSLGSSGLGGVEVFRAKARRAVGVSKCGLWRSCVSGVGRRAPIKEVWDVMGKVPGKTGSPWSGCWQWGSFRGQTLLTIWEKLFVTIIIIQLPESFRGIERGLGWFGLSFRSQNNEVRNEDFDLDELVGAGRLSHGSATGPGGVCCLILKRLPVSSLEALLGV